MKSVHARMGNFAEYWNSTPTYEHPQNDFLLPYQKARGKKSEGNLRTGGLSNMLSIRHAAITGCVVIVWGSSMRNSVGAQSVASSAVIGSPSRVGSLEGEGVVCAADLAFLAPAAVAALIP